MYQEPAPLYPQVYPASLDLERSIEITLDDHWCARSKMVCRCGIKYRSGVLDQLPSVLASESRPHRPVYTNRWKKKVDRAVM